MELKDGHILVSWPDHSYYVALIVTSKAVYNVKTREYSEYVGDDWLGDGEMVIDAKVAK